MGLPTVALGFMEATAPPIETPTPPAALPALAVDPLLGFKGDIPLSLLTVVEVPSTDDRDPAFFLIVADLGGPPAAAVLAAEA